MCYIERNHCLWRKKKASSELTTYEFLTSHQQLLLGTSQARQESIIQQFRSGDVRVIVATSVAEEGIDIPECNLVIKYNHVGNEVSTVQARGEYNYFLFMYS